MGAAGVCRGDGVNFVPEGRPERLALLMCELHGLQQALPFIADYISNNLNMKL
jgi:hypothetical protein